MKRVVVIVLLLFPVMADCFPGSDWEIIVRLEEQLRQLKQQTSYLSQSYQLTQKIKNAQIGHYGYGNLLNSSQDLQQREWSPGNWQDTLHGLSGGNQQRYQQLLATYKSDHAYLSKKQYQQGASAQRTAIYQQQINHNRAATVNASYAFNTIQKHLKTIHQLSAQIDQAENSKAAIDLNSRLLTELAYVQVQNLKMQALLNEQLAEQGANSIEANSAASSFNQLSK